MKMGVTTWTLPSRGIDALKFASENEFDFVHLDIDDVIGDDQVAVDTFLASSKAAGVKLSGFALKELETVGFQSIAACKSVIDRGIEMVALLGIDFVYLPFFDSALIRTQSNLQFAIELAQYALKITRKLNVTVGVEVSLDLPAILLLFESVNDRRLDLLFDTQNPSTSNIEPVSLASGASQYIRRFVHVKDGTTSLGDAVVGRGVSNVFGSVRALLSNNFNGQFVLESNYARWPARCAADRKAIHQIVASTPHAGNASHAAKLRISEAEAIQPNIGAENERT